MGSAPDGKWRPTVADVARVAGVSRTTVSHALNGTGRLGDDTRRRVAEIAEELGYRPNPRAAALRSGQSKVIGFLSSMHPAVNSGPGHLGLYMNLAGAAAESALDREYSLLLLPYVADDRIDRIDRLDIDAAIVVEPAVDDHVINRLQLIGIPFVTIGARREKDDSKEHLAIDLNSEACAGLLFNHLVDRGAHNVALVVGNRERSSYDAARTVYARMAAQHGWTGGVAVADESLGSVDGARCFGQLMSARPRVDAVVGWIDAFAVGAVRAAGRMGLSIPDDVMVATRYDGPRALASIPPLTALDLRLGAAAAAAVKVVLAQLQDGQPPDPYPQVPLPRLIRRASTAR